MCVTKVNIGKDGCVCVMVAGFFLPFSFFVEVLYLSSKEGYAVSSTEKTFLLQWHIFEVKAWIIWSLILNPRDWSEGLK